MDRSSCLTISTMNYNILLGWRWKKVRSSTSPTSGSLRITCTDIPLRSTNSMFHLGGLGRFFGSGNLPETITVLGEKLPRDKGMQLFRKIIWLTYRTEFPCINGQLLTDAGWGCMIRVGQMLMAQALRRHSGAENQDDLTNIVSGKRFIIQPFSTTTKRGRAASITLFKRWSSNVSFNSDSEQAAGCRCVTSASRLRLCTRCDP